MKEEIQIAEFIKSIMPDDIPKFIVDVGANHDAVFSNEFIKNGWEGILIEPQPDCVNSLRKIYQNDFCKIIQKAVSNETCVKQLFLSKQKDSQLATLNIAHDPWFDQIRSSDYISVECDTLTNILDKNECPIDIGILKIDAESHDPHIIESMDWKKYHPVFVVTEEYYWEPENLLKKYTILEQNDYVLLGFVQYNSIWRKRTDDVLFSTFILKKYLSLHQLFPEDKVGNLDYVGRSLR